MLFVGSCSNSCRSMELINSESLSDEAWDIIKKGLSRHDELCSPKSSWNNYCKSKSVQLVRGLNAGGTWQVYCECTNCGRNIVGPISRRLLSGWSDFPKSRKHHWDLELESMSADDTERYRDNSYSAFCKSTEYREWSDAVLNREPICRCCQGVATTAHHIGYSQGRLPDPSNPEYSAGVCNECHAQITYLEKEEYMKPKDALSLLITLHKEEKIKNIMETNSKEDVFIKAYFAVLPSVVLAQLSNADFEGGAEAACRIAAEYAVATVDLLGGEVDE
jgi:hypothetical protein